MDFATWKDLRPQGPRRSDPEREEHLRLVDLGIGNTEACRIIGINRRTGKRRLYGRQASARYRAAPPVVDTGACPGKDPNPRLALRNPSARRATSPRPTASTSLTGSGRSRPSGPSRPSWPQPLHRKPADPPQPRAHVRRRLVLPSARSPVPRGRPRTALGDPSRASVLSAHRLINSPQCCYAP